jgi:hypothetical protein
MKKKKLLASFVLALGLAGNAQAIDLGDVLNTITKIGNPQGGGSSGLMGGMPQYPYQMPYVNIPQDSELEAMVNEASPLVTKAGTTLACSIKPNDYLKGYASPQHGFWTGSVWHQNHQQGTCYQIMNMNATKQARNAFMVNYAFVSQSSGESDRKQISFIKLNGTWYLKD